jgi:energy-coupling factor transport system substrate-specific component
VRRLENLSLMIVSVVGLASFALPFLVSAFAVPPPSATSRAPEAVLLLATLLAGSLFIAVGEVVRGAGAESLSRSVALLGVLVAIDASLRLVPSFLGASPIFALMILVGFVFGPRFGFVMGSLTLLLSAALTAGVGPWLPFQMLCAGWVGLGAGALPRFAAPWARMGALLLFAAFAGIAFGALMNLYSWPFAAPGVGPDTGLYWSPALSLGQSLARYGAFYIATSLVHDVTRALANVVLILFLGAPVIRLLERFRTRTSWASSLASDRVASA